VKLRPGWYDKDDEKGTLKVVMTGPTFRGPRVAEHSRNKARREALGNRFRDSKDSLKVRPGPATCGFTGFDAPSLPRCTWDKPMRGHGLMQAIARVNRVFSDKPGGTGRDYLGWPTS